MTDLFRIWFISTPVCSSLLIFAINRIAQSFQLSFPPPRNMSSEFEGLDYCDKDVYGSEGFDYQPYWLPLLPRPFRPPLSHHLMGEFELDTYEIETRPSPPPPPLSLHLMRGFELRTYKTETEALPLPPTPPLPPALPPRLCLNCSSAQVTQVYLQPAKMCTEHSRVRGHEYYTRDRERRKRLTEQDQRKERARQGALKVCASRTFTSRKEHSRINH
jgi:hypothetical protein